MHLYLSVQQEEVQHSSNSAQNVGYMNFIYPTYILRWSVCGDSCLLFYISVASTRNCKCAL